MGGCRQRSRVIEKAPRVKKEKKEEPRQPAVKRLGSGKTKQKSKKSPEDSATSQKTGLLGGVHRICDNFFKVILWLQIGILNGNHHFTVIMLQVGRPQPALLFVNIIE